MTDDDIDEVLKKNWIEVLNQYNGELINQQMNRFVDLTNSFEIEQAEHILRYQGKFYFVMGIYGQALEDLTKLLEFNPNEIWVIKTYEFIMRDLDGKNIYNIYK